MATIKRPQPIVGRAAIAAAVTVIAAVATAAGVSISDADQDTLVNAAAGVVAGVSVVSTLLAAWRGSRQVTPVSSPVGADGTALVPAAQASPRQDVFDTPVADDTFGEDVPAE